MALSAGTRLGPYEILAPLGAGGMGEVYRAKDTRLDRTVAVKVLPGDLAADAQLKARFEREARAISALAHPNICTLYDVGEEGGQTFLVMEHLVGGTLAERLKKGPVPVDQALDVAAQIADGLAAAHKAGIIHRDLKPGNIMLTKTGARLLDFGLARLTGQGNQPVVENLTSAPTEPEPLTGAGTIMGTLPYMAPEQVEGKEADARTDLWALGAILYEMLTGHRAFEASSAVSLVGAILEREPAPLKERQPLTPPSLERLVRRCLAKDPDERWDTAHDVADELRWIGETAREGHHGGANLRWLRLVNPLLGVAILLLALALWALWPQPAHPLRLEARLSPGVSLAKEALLEGAASVLSPSGDLLVFVGQEGDGPARIYTRPLDRLSASALLGTEGAHSPFFSPDGKWIAFFTHRELKKVSVSGGAVVTLCDAPDSRGGSWGPDGDILFSLRGPAGGLSRVSEEGGACEPFKKPDDDTGQVAHRATWPQWLPGGEAVLYTEIAARWGLDDSNLVIETVPDGRRKVVYRGGYHGRYLPSGHLVFVHEGTLFAAPFDLDTQATTGPLVSALESLKTSPSSGGAQFAFSEGGASVYVAGDDPLLSGPLHWLTRDGRTSMLRPDPANWAALRFSPAGDRLAMQIRDGTQWDVWVYEWTRDTLSRLTFDPAMDGRPIWTPDGHRIVFSSDRSGALNLYWRRSDGSGEVQRLTQSENWQVATSWHPSGRVLAFHESRPDTGFDLMTVEFEGDEETGWKPDRPTVFLRTSFNERVPRFSPDGRWLAYISDESGRREVYVVPFRGPGGKSQVSTGGGYDPKWSRSRPELLYGDPTSGKIMVVPYTVEADSFQPGKPIYWSDVAFVPRGRDNQGHFDLHPDGQRIALQAALETRSADTPEMMVFVTHFFDELRRLTAESEE